VADVSSVWAGALVRLGVLRRWWWGDVGERSCPCVFYIGWLPSCFQVEALGDASRILPPVLTIEYTERDVSQFSDDPTYAVPTVDVKVTSQLFYPWGLCTCTLESMLLLPITERRIR
jgi:hypothetical protein